eukprot:gene7826-10630_t
MLIFYLTSTSSTGNSSYVLLTISILILSAFSYSYRTHHKILVNRYFYENSLPHYYAIPNEKDTSNYKNTKTKRPSFNEAPSTSRTAGSWKVLTEKLTKSTPQATKAAFGKIQPKALSQNNVFDELQCKHFDICSGCTIKGNFTESPFVKQAKKYFLSEGVNLSIFLGNITHWRTTAKLAVQPLSKWGGLKIGLYKSNTHDVEPITDCKVHHQRINEAIEELKASALEIGVKGYSEAKQGIPAQGELRYIQMTVERESRKVQLVLVWNVMNYKEAEQTLPRLVKKLKSRPDLWHSIHVNFQTSQSYNILNFHPKAWKTLWGPPLSIEKIGDAIFYFQPQIFRQSNLDVFEKNIIPTVIRNIPENSLVSELYAGIGTIGLNAAKISKSVLCSDSNEFIDAVFDKCADSLPEADREKVFFECLPAEEAILQGQCDEAEVLIVDPPRKGLDEGVMNLLIDKHPEKQAPNLKRLIYVSCGFEALEKDTRQLISSGKWKLKSADGFLLFPGSDHIEIVAVYDKIGLLLGS